MRAATSIHVDNNDRRRFPGRAGQEPYVARGIPYAGAGLALAFHRRRQRGTFLSSWSRSRS